MAAVTKGIVKSEGAKYNRQLMFVQFLWDQTLLN